jgi:hypothetical protein
MEDIIENATIIYKNGLKKSYDAISITDKGVYAGHIKNKDGMEFVNHSFIPIDQIKKISFFDSNENKDIDFETLKRRNKK